MLDYSEIDSWCAGCKVSGITREMLTHPKFPSLQTIMEDAVERERASCLMVTVNEKEEAVLAWLKANKFRKGPQVKNWGHGGRKTFAYFKQIPRALWREQTGLNNGW